MSHETPYFYVTAKDFELLRTGQVFPFKFAVLLSVMARVLSIIVIAVLSYYGWNWFKREYAEKGRPFLVKFILVTVAVLLLLLAAIGRVHWLGAALAGLLAMLRFALPFVLKSLPFLMKWREAQSKVSGQSDPAVTDQDMDKARALATLGLEEPYTREDVLSAHRRMMQSLHPDKGGSDLLAAQVNAAKDYLLKELIE